MCIVSEFFEKDIRKEDATKTRETDTILSKRPWAFTIHSENSKAWISFPSTNKTLGDSRKRKPFSPPCFWACAENSWKRNRQEDARDAERKGVLQPSGNYGRVIRLSHPTFVLVQWFQHSILHVFSWGSYHFARSFWFYTRKLNWHKNLFVWLPISGKLRYFNFFNFIQMKPRTKVFSICTIETFTIESK